MPGNYFVEVRRQDKGKLLKLLNESPKTPLQQLLGVFSMNTGLSMNTINRMLDEIRLTRLCKHEEVV